MTDAMEAAAKAFIDVYLEAKRDRVAPLVTRLRWWGKQDPQMTADMEEVADALEALTPQEASDETQ